MPYLVDTTILVRLANTVDALYPQAVHAALTLHQRGESLFLTPQNLIEFRNTATRARTANGLGLSVTATENKAALFEATFPVLPETPDIFPAWKAIVRALGVTGKQVHDARLVAVCHVHGVTHLLTFNVRHFARLAATGPGVTVVDPATV
ncbi:MAG TPA: type II toxin-antitoxin system VapC family toxin [Gemmataceae bacterium]|jgi:predicted nucleic acid-binding protein